MAAMAEERKCEKILRCLWPIHPVFPEGAGETYFTGLRRTTLDPVPSQKAVNGGATGECGGSPSARGLV